MMRQIPKVERWVIGMTAVAIVAFTGLASVTAKVEPRADAAPAAPATRGVAEVVRAFLKDPDSARFGPIVQGFEGGWCGTVNARNGFGGYGGEQKFVLAAPHLILLERESDYETFRNAWNEHCIGAWRRQP